MYNRKQKAAIVWAVTRHVTLATGKQTIQSNKEHISYAENEEDYIETSIGFSHFTATFKSGGVPVQVGITSIILNRFLQMGYQHTCK